MSKIEISIIIPCYNEEKYIAKCLDSVINSDFPKENMEVLIIDGMSSDNTRNIIVSKYTTKYSWIKILDNTRKIVPVAMNIGITNAIGSYIIRIDAHSHYSTDYFTKLIFWSKKLKADNIGGICNTGILNNTPKAIAIKKVLSNKFGVGNSIFRIGTANITEVDTVPFGCYKKEVFEKHGLYNEKLIRNQDIELNKRLLKNNGKIFLVPEIKCTYYAREEYIPLAKNNFKNGEWNILTIFFTKDLSSISLRHLIPFFFLLSVLMPLILSIIWFPFIIISGLSLVAYSSLLTIISLKLNDKHTSLFYLLFAFITLHLSYGFGSLIGIIKLPFIAISNK